MKTIFSKIRLKGRQLLGLSMLIMMAAAAEMFLPTLLAEMINRGVTTGRNRMILVLGAAMAGITVLACIVNMLSVRIASQISADFERV